VALSALAVVVVAGGLLIASERRGWRPSLTAALLVALVLRLAMFALAWDRVQPYDVNLDFRVAGENVLQHQDLMLNSRERGWNYLPTYGFVMAAAVSVQEWTGLPWVVVARIPAIVFDLGAVAVVYALAHKGKAGLRAFQYACTPITVLVSAVHGQMEPLCLLLALGAFLALRSRPRAALAGVLIGLAISVKTWPALFLPALLLALPGWAARARLLAAAAVVGLVLLLTQPLTVGSPVQQLPATVARILSYYSPGGSWGWSSVVYAYSPYTAENYEDSVLWGIVGQVGSLLTLLGIAAAIWWWRRADPLVVASVTASTFQITTAGHGAQYLTWPVPFMILRPTRLVPLLQFSIGIWAWCAYFVAGGGLYPAEWSSWFVYAWQMSSLLLVVLFVLALPWRQRMLLGGGPTAGRYSGRRRAGGGRTIVHEHLAAGSGLAERDIPQRE
jgi:Glycosyltransferase family 87